MTRYLMPALLVSVCLSACGYKGPLYVPKPDAAAAKQPASPPAPAEVAPGRPIPAQSAPAPK